MRTPAATGPPQLAAAAGPRLARRLGWLAAAALLIAASLSMLLGVTVRAAGGRRVACGSGWDVVSGRSGWQRWWAQDLADPAGDGSLARTTRCVDAVNARLVLAAVLALAALALLAAVEVYTWRHRHIRIARRSGTGRLWLAGTVMSITGGLLLLGGLAALGVLLADPDSLLFEYVDRPTAALLGGLLLMPALLLVALGGLARSSAQAWDDGQNRNAGRGHRNERSDGAR